MPKFLEKKLEAEYGKGNPRVYATMNAIGAMHGNKETPKGKAMERKHEARHNNAGPEHKAHHANRESYFKRNAAGREHP
jgi:hypothetical protein